jgi:hypothetical protein
LGWEIHVIDRSELHFFGKDGVTVLRDYLHGCWDVRTPPAAFKDCVWETSSLPLRLASPVPSFVWCGWASAWVGAPLSTNRLPGLSWEEEELPSVPWPWGDAMTVGWGCCVLRPYTEVRCSYHVLCSCPHLCFHSSCLLFFRSGDSPGTGHSPEPLPALSPGSRCHSPGEQRDHWHQCEQGTSAERPLPLLARRFPAGST